MNVSGGGGALSHVWARRWNTSLTLLGEALKNWRSGELRR